MKPILLHACCANCACFPYEFLKENSFDVTAFWFNPNIHPYIEYRKRMDAMDIFAANRGARVLYGEEYSVASFLRAMAGGHEIPGRCSKCWEMRLSETAVTAKKMNIGVFTTTLLYSTRQDHEAIREIGNRIAAKNGLEFYYSDFRKGWQKGIELSRGLGLYRQNYCGCIFSEEERYLGKK